MIYTLDEIRSIVKPIAQKYGLKAVYLFGSYARGTATEESDVDLLIDTSGTTVKSLLQVAAIYCELEEALGKPVDLLTVSALEQRVQRSSELAFREEVWNGKVDLYVAA
ncbi:MAG: nucleotidyltransferase [Ruminococcaceae bacterium]|nr:nucleotidyltransferase [Oscillospiraceae bacterium]